MMDGFHGTLGQKNDFFFFSPLTCVLLILSMDGWLGRAHVMFLVGIYSDSVWGSQVDFSTPYIKKKLDSGDQGLSSFETKF